MKTALLIGAAGSGKTTELLNIMDKVLQSHVPDPHNIGFVSFTRAARKEAAERAADRFGVSGVELQQGDGWFRTLDSCCYKCLQPAADSLLVGDADSQHWLAEELEFEVSSPTRERGAEEVFSGTRTPADRALALWETARAKLRPVREIWEWASYCDPQSPGWDLTKQILEQYELVKRIGGRRDFSDLRGEFAGYRFSVEDGPEERMPCGDVPDIPVWFLDEAQDNSPLTDAVARRLTQKANYIYLCGDAFQAVYGFAGSDPALFQSWNEDKKKVMPKSWRCGPAILEYGEAILSACSDYWDRGVAPADHQATVERVPFSDELIQMLDPQDDWLLIARTNYLAGKITKLMDAHGLPWSPTKGRGGINAPVKMKAINAFLKMGDGGTITGSDWAVCLQYIKSDPYLQRGAKAFMGRYERDEADYVWPAATLEETKSYWGANEQFIEDVRAGKWIGWIDKAESIVESIRKHGADAVLNSRIRIGTIHSVKGAEADNVMLLDTLTMPCYQAAQTPEGYDEEQRVFYVGATRARSRLVVASEPRVRLRKKLP